MSRGMSRGTEPGGEETAAHWLTLAPLVTIQPGIHIPENSHWTGMQAENCTTTTTRRCYVAVWWVSVGYSKRDLSTLVVRGDYN